MQDNKKPKDYPAHTSGGLWSQQKTNQGQPDMKGKIEITQHQMQQLVQMGKMGQEPSLQIAAWSKQSQSGSNWLSIDADVYAWCLLLLKCQHQLQPTHLRQQRLKQLLKHHHLHSLWLHRLFLTSILMSIFKDKPIRSKKLLSSARGESCVNCGARDDTVVAAHYQGLRSLSYGKGKSQKPHDMPSYLQSLEEYEKGLLSFENIFRVTSRQRAAA